MAKASQHDCWRKGRWASRLEVGTFWPQRHVRY